MVADVDGERKKKKKRQGELLQKVHLNYFDKGLYIYALPLRRRATLGSLCTGLMSSSTSVCLPHSGLAWLICIMEANKIEA